MVSGWLCGEGETPHRLARRVCGEAGIEGRSIFQHGTGDAEKPIGDGSERLCMAVASGSQGLVAGFAGRVVLGRDASPVVDGVAQSDIGCLTHLHSTHGPTP